MPEAPRPPEEESRIQTLETLGILDTPPEERFDRITRLVCHILDVPISLVSLLHRERQWFKSRVGVDLCETGREVSFCAYAVYEKAPLVIENALKDERVRDMQVVLDAPYIRAYAGIPLIMQGGDCVGTLCAIDVKPRKFTEQQLSCLRDLAKMAADELGNVALNTSIANLKAKTEELTLAREAAEKANKAKSEFLAIMSHEIRTPLNGILGFLSELKESQLPPQESEYVRMASASGDLMLSLINDILDLSKIEAGRLELESIPVNLEQLVYEVAAPFEALAKTKKVDFNKSVVTNGKSEVFTDPTRLKQILLNLLSNALKFTNSGYIALNVKALEDTATEDSMEYLFNVSDTGIGIPSDKVTRLFQPYEQLDKSTTRRFGGTGLGLSICKRLVEHFNGTLSVTSEPGKGSTFSFTIRVSKDKSKSQKAPVTDHAKGAEPLCNDKRVLVVEDNPVNSRLIEIMLKRLGVSPVFAKNGREALSMLEVSGPFDTIFMDIHMPVLDGRETSKRIRELVSPTGKRPKIVALTGYNSTEERKACKDAGMDFFLTKPFSFEDVRRALTLS